MFTGIIDHWGEVKSLQANRLQISASIPGVKLGSSIGVNGVCLTVVALSGRGKKRLMDFDLSEETLRRSTLGELAPGMRVNLESALRIGDTLGGHFVLGHVDGKGRLISKAPAESSVVYEFSIPSGLNRYMVSKGSVAVDGISLTVVDLREGSFTAAIIPYTEEQTTLGTKKIGEPVNLEVDVLSKHVEKLLRGWTERESTDDLFVKKTIAWDPQK
ncbi:MAG: riboflavin synthase [Elusimicrobia bacterium]|nr:riboflavin synthase [Elusimicrobiota bacterium]